MALPITALTETTTVEDELGLVGGAEASRIERYINAASDMVRAHLNRAALHFETNIEESLRPTAQPRLVLGRYPVVAVHSAVIDGAEVEDYSVDSLETGVLYRADGWTSTDVDEPRPIVITYDAGWVTPRQAEAEALERTLPFDIEHATVLTVSMLYRQRGVDPTVASESLGEASVSYRQGLVTALPLTVIALLAPYRRPLSP